jgi:hypothetical protein
MEPVFDREGRRLEADVNGVDTEGIAPAADGSFWVGEEFCPSLLNVDAQGRVSTRWVPRGIAAALAGADYAVEERLPELARRRRLNRGFEGLAISPDGRCLYAAFQSALAHPDKQAFERGRHIRIWKLDVETAGVSEYVYPLDPAASFTRDRVRAPVAAEDVKISELEVLGADQLLVLERISETTKLYRVDLRDAKPAPAEFLELDHRPTLEELSPEDLRARGIAPLRKLLLFSSDDAPELPRDMEGMLVLSPQALLLVNDNDFGAQGAKTCFARLTFDEPVFEPRQVL